MTVHNPPSRQSLEETDFTALFNKTRRDIIGLKGGEELGEGWGWSYGHTIFRAILQSYDAGYYVYLLGQVYSLDIWEAGFKADTTNKEQGRRFRYQLLEKGGSQPEAKTLEEYLGRKPSSKAFCEVFGISMPGYKA